MASLVAERDVAASLARAERYACPDHIGDKPRWDGERLWCVICKRELADAIKVVIAPLGDWDAAIDDERDRVVAVLNDRADAARGTAASAALRRAANYIAHGGQ